MAKMNHRRLIIAVKWRIKRVANCRVWLGSYRQRIQQFEFHASDLSSSSARLADARMWAHSLDKALHREDWRPGHSAKAISRVNRFLESEDSSGDPTGQWIAGIAEQFRERQLKQEEKYDPISSPEVIPPCISAESMREALTSRVSSRQYLLTEVDEKSLELISEAAINAPNSSNRQTIRLWFVKSKSSISKILPHFPGATCFSAHIPCVVVFGADLRPYSAPQELYNPAVDTALAASNACMMAYSLGLSITLLSWGKSTQENEDAVRSELGIPDHVAIYIGGVCGFPSRQTIKPVRMNPSSYVEVV